MKHKFLLGFFFVFLLLVSTVSAVTFENGSSFGYDNMTVTFGQNTTMDNFSTYSTGFLFGDHNITLYTNESSNLTVNSWSESSNSFSLNSDSLIYFDISVSGVSQYVYYDDNYVTSPFLASGIKSFFYQSDVILVNPDAEGEDAYLDNNVLEVRDIILLASGLLSIFIIVFIMRDVLILLKPHSVSDNKAIMDRVILLFVVLLIIVSIAVVSLIFIDALVIL